MRKHVQAALRREIFRTGVVEEHERSEGAERPRWQESPHLKAADISLPAIDKRRNHVLHCITTKRPANAGLFISTIVQFLLAVHLLNRHPWCTFDPIRFFSVRSNVFNNLQVAPDASQAASSAKFMDIFQDIRTVTVFSLTRNFAFD